MVERECNSVHQARQTGLYGSHGPGRAIRLPARDQAARLFLFTDDALVVQGRYFCTVHPEVFVEHLVFKLPQQGGVIAPFPTQG